MSVKILALALAGAPVLVSAAPQPMYVNAAEIVQIRCGNALGTGFRRGSNGIVSADHVTRNGNCSVKGIPMEVTWSDRDKDISISRLPTSGPGMKFDCSGMKEGEVLFGIGYADGLPLQRVLIGKVSSEARDIAPWGDFTVLYTPEAYIPGMSGGTVVTKDGAVKGIVKGYLKGWPISYARDIKGTPLCAGDPQ